MDKNFEMKLLVWGELNRIISEDLIDSEKKDLAKLMDILKIDTWFVVVFFFKNENLLLDFLIDLDLSRLNKDPKLIKLYKDFVGDSKISSLQFKRLQEIFRSISVIVFSNKAFRKDPSLKIFFDLHKDNLFLIDERLNGINLDSALESKPESENRPEAKTLLFTRFMFLENHDKKEFNFFKALKDEKKIDINTLEEDFKVVFSTQKISKKFKKVNWIGSIFQLKKIIKIMIDKKIIYDDINYLDTIINCFLLKGEQITKKKLDARGKLNTIAYQQPLLDHIFFSKKK